MRKRTLKEFIEKANVVHGHKYQYGEAVYVESWTKLIITCPVHGNWRTEPANHLAGHGCPGCKFDKLADNKRTKVGEFVKRANLVHNGKYDYSLVHYTNTVTKVEVGCKKHGSFFQTPANHLKGHGCAECGRTTSRGEETISSFLTKNQIQFETQKSFPGLKGKRKHLLFDFWLPHQNILIEFDGVQHTRSGSFTNNPAKAAKCFEALETNDKRKTQFAQDNEICLIRISYCQLDEIENILSSQLL